MCYCPSAGAQDSPLTPVAVGKLFFLILDLVILKTLLEYVGQ